MKHRLLLAPVLAAVALGAQAAGTVTVSFVDPNHFIDAGRWKADVERNTQILADYMRSRFAPRLPDGQELKIDVTELDLAGWNRFGPQGDLRVLRGGADWPRITLRWELAENGRTVKAGEDRLADMNYLLHVPPSMTNEGELPYEKRLLADWFKTRFAPQP